MANNHEFQTDLRYSQLSQVQLHGLGRFLKQRLPHAGLTGEIEPADLAADMAGADYLAPREDGPALTLQVKKRRRRYPDVAIEHARNVELQRPGWAVDPDMNADALVYFCEQGSTFWLFDYQLLKRAVADSLPLWRSRWGDRHCPTYRGGSVAYHAAITPVPAGRVWGAMKRLELASPEYLPEIPTALTLAGLKESAGGYQL